MKLLPIILCCFVFINLTLSWHKCTEFSVQQYLCNYTTFDTNSNSSACYPHPICVYDNAQSVCFCKYLSPCYIDTQYRLVQLNYSISLQLDNNNKQGIFSLSNLTTSYLHNVTTYRNSSLIPTGLNVSYSTGCDGSLSNYYYYLGFGQVLFNTTTNFTFDHNCDSFDDLNALFFGPPIYKYAFHAFKLYEYKGTYYINHDYYINGSYGSMLVPENPLTSFYGNFTCLSFNSIPDPPTFQDHCNKYISQSLYNDTTVLVVAYEYNDSYVSVSASINNIVSYAIVTSGVIVIRVDGAETQHETSYIPPHITNYIHHYDHQLVINNTKFYFSHHIVLYNQNSYINETNYFTYDDSCTTKTIYDNYSRTYLTNEFCCVEWKIAGPTSSPSTVSPTSSATTVSPTPSPTTVSPTSSATTVSPTSSPTVSPTSSATTVSPTSNPTTTVKTSQSTTLTTSTVHPSQSSNTCSNGWYQSLLASISIWIVSVCALFSRSENL